MLDEGNAEYLDKENGILNIEKVLMLGKMYRRFISAQKEHYPLSVNDVMKKYIIAQRSKDLSIDILEQMSWEIEPRKRKVS